MEEPVYTAITFAPVQGFIEKSRKLRDLYGSSYLLSYLSQAICDAAEPEYTVISPALPNITQGMPNQIILKGAYANTSDGQSEMEQKMRAALETAWTAVVDTCRLWIEDQLKPSEWEFCWKREWGLWAKHAWEFFYIQGEPNESITDVRTRLNEKKRSRDWTGINWQGESSTLSGTDAIARPGMGRRVNPKQGYFQQETDIKSYFKHLTTGLKTAGIIQILLDDKILSLKNPEIRTEAEEIRAFYTHLSHKLGEAFALSIRKQATPQEIKQYGSAFVDPREELSIPELIKRLITHKVIVRELIQTLRSRKIQISAKKLLELSRDLNQESFRDVSRLPQKNDSTQRVYWTGWFQGDGDGAGDYLKELGKQGAQVEETGTTGFSTLMRKWGEEFQNHQSRYLPDGQGRVVYAGGDDLLGILYAADAQIQPKQCLDWFTTFKSTIWNGIDPTQTGQPKPITVSIGFVWAAPKIPQREVLQHCREAEKVAKRNGKDRIAFRILFNSGNHLDWVCPWDLLEAGLLQDYRDRNGGQNWTHFYNDVAVLESRHAFEGNQIDVAIALFSVYFPNFADQISLKDRWWNRNAAGKRIFSGILGDCKDYENNGVLEIPKVHRVLNGWIINLAKVGFHLHREYKHE